MILLVDGNAVACALWWARPAEAARRFEDTLLRLADQHLEHWDAVLVCWDTHAPSWRREIMPSYKSNRPPKPASLVEALRDCRALGRFEHVERVGFEADDLIATITRARVAADDDVLILSGDKDFHQLVGPRVRMLSLKGEILDAAGVEARWGVPPERMRFLFSWMGDAADCLPGVRGVGPKRAIAHALAGEVGDVLTYELCDLATVPNLDQY